MGEYRLMNELPLMSVIIPTYNRAGLINRALQSVLNQSYPNVEIVIVDDASTDDTERVIAELKLPNTTYCKNKVNMGSQASRNIGIKLSRGQYINFLDSDDELMPQKLELQYRTFLKSSPDVGVVYSYCGTVDDASKVENEWCFNLQGNIYKQLLRSPSIDFITPLVKRECLEKIGFLDELVASYQEWDTLLRISKYYRFQLVPEKLAVYHYHSGETISKDIGKDLLGYVYIVKKHRRDILRNCSRAVMAHHYRELTSRYFLNNQRLRGSIQYSRALAYNPIVAVYDAYAFTIRVLSWVKHIKNLRWLVPQTRQNMN